MIISNYSQFVLETLTYTSDALRADLIELALEHMKSDPEYNIEEPDFDMLCDPHEGYDYQSYVQNDLEHKQIISYEGYSSYCWKALFDKPEYKPFKKNKIGALEKFCKERVPEIAKELNLEIKSTEFIDVTGEYHDYDGEPYSTDYILKITFLLK